MTITAGMTSSSFDVDIIDNMIQDGDKIFTITIRLISTCLPVTINSDTTTVTITDDEGTVYLKVLTIFSLHETVMCNLLLEVASLIYAMHILLHMCSVHDENVCVALVIGLSLNNTSDYFCLNIASYTR